MDQKPLIKRHSTYSIEPNQLVSKVNVRSVSKKKADKLDKTLFAYIVAMGTIFLLAFYIHSLNATMTWVFVGVMIVIACLFKARMNKIETLRAKTHGSND